MSAQPREYRTLLVAPYYLRSDLLELIHGQAHERGRIVLKLNAVVDPDMIDALYEASQAGAVVELIVRSICCLRPGMEGLSDRIRVRSLVGRYLEHSRIFRFGDRGDASFYIGSADLMQRNLDRRVEALVPVSDPSLTARLDEVLEVLLTDDTLAWTLGSDGTWTKVRSERDVDAQQRLQEMAVERSGPERG